MQLVMANGLEMVLVPRGIKRPAEDSLEKEQRLAKRLSLLSLGNSLLHNTSPPPALAAESTARPDDADALGFAPMQVDDTKDRVYIANIDDELSRDDDSDDKIVFLPDIEKRLTKIPKALLLTSSPPTTGTELVLYNIPSSLSVPEEQDSVRKAIIETRARALQRQQLETKPPIAPELASGMAADGGAVADTNRITEIEDDDAMDLG